MTQIGFFAQVKNMWTLAGYEAKSSLNAFLRAEEQDLSDNVYHPLSQEHSSLEYVTSLMNNSMEQGANYVRERHGSSKIGRTIKRYRKIFSSKIAGLDQENEDVKAVQHMLDIIGPFVEFYSEFKPIKEDIYSRMARAIMDVSVLKATPADELIIDQENRLDVYKRAFRVRSEAESFFESTVLELMYMTEIAAGLAAYSKFDERIRNHPNAEELRNELPTSEAFNAVRKGLTKHYEFMIETMYTKV